MGDNSFDERDVIDALDDVSTRQDDTDAYLKRVKTMTEPARQPDQWLTPALDNLLRVTVALRGERTADLRERAKDELAALRDQLAAREQQLTSLREAARDVASWIENIPLWDPEDAEFAATVQRLRALAEEP